MRRNFFYLVPPPPEYRYTRCVSRYYLFICPFIYLFYYFYSDYYYFFLFFFTRNTAGSACTIPHTIRNYDWWANIRESSKRYLCRQRDTRLDYILGWWPTSLPWPSTWIRSCITFLAENRLCSQRGSDTLGAFTLGKCWMLATTTTAVAAVAGVERVWAR